MIENTNDYMSVLAVVFIIFFFIGMIFRVVSIRATARHLKEEAEYYSKDRKQLEEKK